MRNTGVSVKAWSHLCIGIALAFSLLGGIQRSFAQQKQLLTFDSPQQTTEALYTAAKTHNQQVIRQLVGELASSGDQAEDKLERDQFVRKYHEMHRLVKESDGTTVLYIGAENWPFPVPLVSTDGKWHFDVDAGQQEILFRQIGENELTAIATCRALLLARQQWQGRLSDDASIGNYARSFIMSEMGSPGKASNNAKEDLSPFHGYYFRVLDKQWTTSNERRFIFVAYPADYRVSGIMTFAATQDGKVYENDVGPNTETAETKMKSWTLAAA